MIITSGHDLPTEQDNPQREEGVTLFLNGQAINAWNNN